MKKKFLVVFFSLIVLAIISALLIYVSIPNDLNDIDKIADAITNEKVTYKTFSYITEEMLRNTSDSKPMTMFRYSYTPEKMLELSDTIALVTIVSIDGASTEYNNMFGMTYGKILVENIITGDKIENDIVSYIKPGGILTFANWEKTQPQAANEKRKYLREQSGTEIDKDNTYIRITLGNDIELETGKTYLAYLNYNEIFDKYEIIGLGNGLRELNVEQQINEVKVQNIDSYNNDLKIKDNTTGEWESLDLYIKNNITKENEK